MAYRLLRAIRANWPNKNQDLLSRRGRVKIMRRLPVEIKEKRLMWGRP